MSGDFLKRTAERALGQATVVTPLAASAYEPLAGFGADTEVWAPPAAEPERARPGQSAAPARPIRPVLPGERPQSALPSSSRLSGEEASPTDPAKASTPAVRRGFEGAADVEAPLEERSATRREEEASGVAAEVTQPSTSGVDAVPLHSEPPPTAPEPTLDIAEPRVPRLVGDATRPRPPGAPSSQQPVREPTAQHEPPTKAAEAAEKSSGTRESEPEPAASAESLEPTLSPEASLRLPSLRTGQATPPDAGERPPAWSPPPPANSVLGLTTHRRDEPPPVRVTIGRVEIRGEAAPTPPLPAAPPPSQPALSLDEYLRTRGGVA
jgi:hypothetical protein